MPTVTSGANLLIAVGFIIMFVGFLGCCGAIRESQFLLMAFYFSVFMCFSLLMAAGLWAVAWQPRLPIYLHNSLEKLVKSYKTDGDPEDVNILNFIQNKFVCCGAVGVVDYSNSPVPTSCGSSHQEQTQRPGCQYKILQSGQENLSTMTGIGIGFAAIMVRPSNRRLLALRNPKINGIWSNASMAVAIYHSETKYRLLYQKNKHYFH
ncbi:unnamed protein product [Mesocestoides corti]|uniref:Uncharacterized protein n=1 Tax=Mesocestoides corti TaxID=53468 RepID=A0A0R3U3X2_MESCO|nr:unnamed protein product [Mesocestoides corti]